MIAFKMKTWRAIAGAGLLIFAVPLATAAGGGMGMGQGMMSGEMTMGPGMEQGMMGMMGPGGSGMGPGMMQNGTSVFDALNLTDDQRAKIRKIQDEKRKANWDLMGKAMDEHAQLRDLYAEDTPDPKKVGAAYGRMAKLHQQIIESDVDAWNRMQAVLTNEQKEQLKEIRRGGYGTGQMHGYGMMRR